MKHLKLILSIKLEDTNTGEILCENETVSFGNAQTVIHSADGIAKAVTHAFNLASGKDFLEKQASGEQLK